MKSKKGKPSGGQYPPESIGHAKFKIRLGILSAKNDLAIDFYYITLIIQIRKQYGSKLCCRRTCTNSTNNRAATPTFLFACPLGKVIPQQPRRTRTMASRACTDCWQAKTRSEFSTRQWRKGVGRSRCMDCIAGISSGEDALPTERDSNESDSIFT